MKLVRRKLRANKVLLASEDLLQIASSELNRPSLHVDVKKWHNELVSAALAKRGNGKDVSGEYCHYLSLRSVCDEVCAADAHSITSCALEERDRYFAALQQFYDKVKSVEDAKSDAARSAIAAVICRLDRQLHETESHLGFGIRLHLPSLYPVMW